MTQYNQKSFSVAVGGSKEYAESWERVFGSQEFPAAPPTVPNRSDIRKQVEEFHKTFGHPVNTVPGVPSDEQVQLRLKLITEEYLELLESIHVVPQSIKDYLYTFCACFNRKYSPNDHVNLPEFIDALADLDFVIEGARLAFGVNGKPIADEVMRSNMSKAGPDGKPILNEDGKVMKGPNYSPPGILGELRKQGYSGE